jgi:hypothetical protein
MARRNRDTRAILKTIERSDERSPLFWWMVEHHDEMIQSAHGQRIRWASFCARAVEKGLVDTRGRPPTERNARETWAQARRAVQEARAQLAARPPKPVYPSRMPKWTPPAILAAIEAGNPAVTGGVPIGAGDANAAYAKAEHGLMLRQAPPPPLPPPKPTTEHRISRLASPDDPPEIHEAYAALEDQFDKADWYLMTGKPKKKEK